MKFTFLKTFIAERIVTVIGAVAISIPVASILTGTFGITQIYGFFAAAAIVHLARWAHSLNTDTARDQDQGNKG